MSKGREFQIVGTAAEKLLEPKHVQTQGTDVQQLKYRTAKLKSPLAFGDIGMLSHCAVIGCGSNHIAALFFLLFQFSGLVRV